jgi:hypothetical protein
VVAFTWQRYKKPLPATAPEWRRLEKITMAAEADAPHPYAGMSVLDIMWQDLDDCMDQLMEQGTPDGGAMYQEFAQKNSMGQARTLRDEWYAALKDWGELRGQAQGLAFAIAVLTNPYAANVPAVKKEAMQRWETRNKR